MSPQGWFGVRGSGFEGFFVFWIFCVGSSRALLTHHGGKTPYSPLSRSSFCKVTIESEAREPMNDGAWCEGDGS